MASKVFTEETAEQVALWQVPTVGAEGNSVPSGPVHNPASDDEETSGFLQPLTAEQLEAIQESARREGFQEGREAGIAAGSEEVRSKAQEWSALLESMRSPYDQLDQRVIDELLMLVTAVSRQIVQRELQMAPDEIIRVIKEARSVLPSQDADIQIELHPQDADLVREWLSDNAGQSPWHLIENPALTRGGCHVKTDVNQVDATVEQRMNRTIAAMLGDRRGAEREENERHSD
ncbi:FliH/SctL family protein [Acidihalobacter prosperus]